MEWHKLTQKQRDLCRRAQQEEREDVATWLHGLSLQRLKGTPEDLLRTAAGTIRRNGHRRIPGLDGDQQKGLEG